MAAGSRWLAFLLLLAGCGGGAPEDVDPQEKPTPEPERIPARFDFQSVRLLDGLERHRLENGMVFLVKEDHRLPIVSIMTAYRVGSVHEDPGITGVSHFLEHMLFKGTDEYGPGDIDLMTYRAGGENNAFTTHDMTGYWFRVSSDRFEDFIRLEADRMTKATLDEGEFESEKNVILEELNRDLDEPWGKLEMAVEKTVFRHSRYHHPILGWREDLKNLPRDQLVAFYRNCYQPNNALLVVIGDVKSEEAVRIVKKHFGAIEKGTGTLQAVAGEPPQEAERILEIETDSRVDRLLVGYRSDRIGSSSDHALDVIGALLTRGKTARLNRRLVEREGMAALGDVESVNDARMKDGVFWVYIQFMPHANLKKGVEALQEELDQLKSRPVEPRELAKAKNQVISDFLFRYESSTDLAESIGYYEAIGATGYLDDYLARVDALTPEDLMKVAQETFGRERRTVGYALAGRRGGVEDDGEEKDDRKRRCPGRRARGPQEVPALGDVFERKLSNGLQLIVKRKTGLPLVFVRAYVRTGPLWDPEDKAGLAHIVGEMLDEGVRDPDGGRDVSDQEIAGKIEFVGGELRTGPDGVSVKVLSRDRNLAYDLVRDLIRHPSFPPKRLVQIREEVLAGIAASKDDPRNRARQLFYETAYDGHPRHRPAEGYRGTVEGIRREDLVGFHKQFYRPDNTVVVVVGDVEVQHVIGALSARFLDWRGDGKLVRLSPKDISPRKREAFGEAETNQANIYLGHPGIRRSDPDYVPLAGAVSILCRSAGFTDRLSKTVRDQMGLAYSVGGILTAGADEAPGPFLVYVGTRNDQRREAIRTVVEELRRFVKDGPTVEEVDDARNHLSRNVVFDWETSEGVAAYLLECRRFGLGLDYGMQFVKALKSVSREEVHKAVREHLDPDNLTIVVVGRKE